MKEQYSSIQYLNKNRRYLLLVFLLMLSIVILIAQSTQTAQSMQSRIFNIASVKTLLKIQKNHKHLKLDGREPPNETEIVRDITQKIPYLPIDDILNPHYKYRHFNDSCAWYPNISDIKIHNDYWQEYYHPDLTFYIFGAYMDNRPTVTFDEPVVRLIVMLPVVYKYDKDYPKSYCQLWYKAQPEPFIVEAQTIRRIWYYRWGHSEGHNYPHLLTCPLPEQHKSWIPQTVSVVANPCDTATNMLKVVYEPLKEGEQKKGFAVCVKALDYPHIDNSNRIVEYIETMRTLGAEKMLMYNLHLVHPNATKVLDYYQRSGFLEYRPFSLSMEVAVDEEYLHLQITLDALTYMLHEVIPYNDCLYRNMYRYQHIAVVDTDEVPTPVGKYSSWSDLVKYSETFKNENCKKFASLCFRCIYFPRYPEKPAYSKEIPEYFYMLQHVYRVREHIRPDWATKCLHNTDYVIATHNHFSIHNRWDVCRNLSFTANVAQLQHYREPRVPETWKDPVVDTNLLRFKDQIIQRSMKVFEDLNFYETVTVEP